jgi:hypothetical protein
MLCGRVWRPPKKTGWSPHEWVRLSLQEVRRLFTHRLTPARQTWEKVLSWPRWRRRHQARAMRCHYQRRAHLTEP